MIIRHATRGERQAWAQRPGVWINLEAAEVFVAEDKGKVIGFLCAQKIFHVDHLVLFSGNTVKRSRAALQLYRGVEKFIRNPLTNRDGIRQMICFTRRAPVKGWADRLGWTRCFERAAAFTKFF
jgi:hypothetical protein